MNSIGSRFKFLRKSKALTQWEFAKSVGISQGTLSDIEKNKYKPSVDTILSVSQYFNVSTDWILTGNMTKHESFAFMSKDNGIDCKSNNMDKSITYFLNQLSEKDKDEICFLTLFKYLNSQNS
ncbi:helix-turn-helix transcriptional regulator [Clostridiisalibacter paucivorans]|uniref:helix-turn-helix transcriptional regulator n=1 Tax=Clostridiisalibacter paucivorans TaxID=408753 RepID=UPI000684B6F6|nr:helix-turn-helix transcriptional regulator [Clostridiisalibacter paucivorans]